jgi:hypothetical protein
MSKNTDFTKGSLWNILTVTSIQRTSISRKARDLRESIKTIPSGEVVLRWFKNVSIDELNDQQGKSFLSFLNSLPPQFQQARKKGMILAIDFYKDPNYSKEDSEYIYKSVPKASTNRFYRFLTVLWVNAPVPVTLGVRFVKTGQPIAKLAMDVLEPLLEQEKIACILADGRFYNWDFVSYFCWKGLPFIIRACPKQAKKIFANKWQNSLQEPNQGVIIDYNIKKRNYKTPCPVRLLLWRENEDVISFIFPRGSVMSAKTIRNLYRQRFVIETYYRMMHRFLAFSCSRHPSVRFILVLLAFWLCNLWSYFKASLLLLKPLSRRFRADITYSANDFCEFILSSWHMAKIGSIATFSRR